MTAPLRKIAASSAFSATAVPTFQRDEETGAYAMRFDLRDGVEIITPATGVRYSLAFARLVANVEDEIGEGVDEARVRLALLLLDPPAEYAEYQRYLRDRRERAERARIRNEAARAEADAAAKAAAEEENARHAAEGARAKREADAGANWEAHVKSLQNAGRGVHPLRR